MTLKRLSISQFRNIHQAEIELHPQMNFFTGANGAGKTSLLEALYFLGRARSFRCRDADHLIETGQPFFSVFAESVQHNIHIHLGMQRFPRHLLARLNGASIKALSQLADHIPLLFISSDNQPLLTESPAIRRSFLDWGLFHSVSGYSHHHKRFVTALRNRNKALKQHASQSEIQAWNPELAEHGEAITEFRRSHFHKILEIMLQEYADLVSDLDLSGSFFSGWKAPLSLLSQLEKDFDRDRKMGFTHSGPHRDDFKIETRKMDASVVLSRGQQKRFNIAFALAQRDIISCAKEISVITMIDDLTSEIDSTNLVRILSRMADSKDQFLITAIDLLLIPEQFRSKEMAKMFHVEHGRIT